MRQDTMRNSNDIYQKFPQIESRFPSWNCILIHTTNHNYLVNKSGSEIYLEFKIFQTSDELPHELLIFSNHFWIPPVLVFLKLQVDPKGLTRPQRNKQS